MTLFGFVIRLIWRIPKYTADTDEQLNRNRSSELWIQLKCTGEPAGKDPWRDWFIPERSGHHPEGYYFSSSGLTIYLTHSGETAHGPVSSGRGAQLLKPQGREQKEVGTALVSHPPISDTNPNTGSRGRNPSGSPAHLHTVGLQKTCFKMPALPSSCFLSPYWEAVPHVTEGKSLSSEECYFRDKHALLRSSTRWLLHRRVSADLTAVALRGTQRDAGVDRAGVTKWAGWLSKAKPLPGALEDCGSGLPVPSHDAFTLCSAASSSTGSAKAPGMPRPLLLMKNVTKGGETLAQVAQRSCGCPIPGSVQGQVGQGLLPGLMEGVPAHGRGVGTWWSLRSLWTQTILWFYDASLQRFTMWILAQNSAGDRHLKLCMYNVYRCPSSQTARGAWGLFRRQVVDVELNSWLCCSGYSGHLDIYSRHIDTHI